jgi:hypothetical protein
MVAPETNGPVRLLEAHPSGERGVSVRSLMRNAGQFRDGSLVLAALSYGLGYVTWATFAAAHDLGGVPALYADYCITGLFPLLLLAALYPLIRLIGLFRRWTQGTPSPRWDTVAKWLSYVASVLILASLPMRWMFSDRVYGWILAAFGAVWLGRVLVARGTSDNFSRGLLIFMLWYALVLSAIVGLVAYWEQVFSRWPQALGGPRPRCVMFDVDAGKLSPPMRATLLGNPQVGDTAGMHVSRPVYSIFSGGDFVLVKVRPQPLMKQEPVFRIPKAALGAESPCPPAAP